MSRVFAIGDPHLGHRKAAQLRGFASSEQHDRAFVEAWNRTVTKRDVVYVLGDVFKLDLVPLLHGTKKLALGNHDKRPIRAYIDLFSQVHAMFEFDGCLLTHVPVNESQRYRYELNVHGHTHAKHLDDDWFVPVSVEHCPRMEPLPLRELIQARRQRIKDGPPECVLFAKEAAKLGIAGVWERLRADGDSHRIFVATASPEKHGEVDASLYALAYRLFPGGGYPFLISVRTPQP